MSTVTKSFFQIAVVPGFFYASVCLSLSAHYLFKKGDKWLGFFFLHWIQAIGQMKTNKQAQTSDVLTKESWFCVCVSFCKTNDKKN